jgi:hypothetical protein
VKGAIKDKSATAFLTLRWTFPAKRACVATDTEPDRLAAVFGDEGSQLKQARRRSPVTPPGPTGGSLFVKIPLWEPLPVAADSGVRIARTK